MNRKCLFGMILLAMGFGGCATKGTTTSPSTAYKASTTVHETKKVHKSNASFSLIEKSENFIKGKTTYNEVVRELGEPDRYTEYSDGKWVEYEGVMKSGAGGNREKTLHMRFDNNDVLYLKVIN